MPAAMRTPAPRRLAVVAAAALSIVSLLARVEAGRGSGPEAAGRHPRAMSSGRNLDAAGE